jgi:4-coumarate--CoA ligase
VVALFAPNDIDYPVIIFGTLWAGGVVSLVNSGYTSSELEFQLVDSSPRVLVTHASLLPVVLPAVEKIGFPTDKIVLLGDKQRASDSTLRHFRSLQGLKNSKIPYSIEPEQDTACLVYSSGTTGKPKGVMLTHRNLVSNILMNILVENGNLNWRGGPTGDGDKTIGFLPFFHSYGKCFARRVALTAEVPIDADCLSPSGLTVVLMQAIYLGVENIVMPKFDLEKYCAVIEQRKATWATVVPPVVLLLSKSAVVGKYDLSSLRIVLSGAAPLTKELMSIVTKRLKIVLRQGYGLSETSPVIYAQVCSIISRVERGRMLISIC